jgi:DNA-binding NtrC family response regulator
LQNKVVVVSDILIVDDQPYVRELLSEELILAGHRVHTVGDAESVRERLMFCRPDLVLLDLYLDGPDGWEVLPDIKRQYPNLPVIIFTAYDTFRDDPRLSQADGYIIKGIDFNPLKQGVATLLRRKQDSQGTPEARSHASEVDLADGF